MPAAGIWIQCCLIQVAELAGQLKGGGIVADKCEARFSHQAGRSGGAHVRRTRYFPGPYLCGILAMQAHRLGSIVDCSALVTSHGLAGWHPG